MRGVTIGFSSVFSGRIAITKVLMTKIWSLLKRLTKIVTLARLETNIASF